VSQVPFVMFVIVGFVNQFCVVLLVTKVLLN